MFADSLREVTAYFHSGRDTQLVGKSGSHIGLMNDRRNLTALCCNDNRNGNKSSLGENNIRFQLFQQFSCLGKSFQHTERIGEVLHIKITS